MNQSTYEIVIAATGDEVITRIDPDGKTWTIPKDEGNSDYVAYFESLKPVEKPKSK
jgi:hypothetical protein